MYGQSRIEETGRLVSGVWAVLVVAGWVLLALILALGVIWTIHHVHVVEPYRDPDSRTERPVHPNDARMFEHL